MQADGDESNMDWESETIVGTCQNIEKPYLRLTQVTACALSTLYSAI